MLAEHLVDDGEGPRGVGGQPDLEVHDSEYHAVEGSTGVARWKAEPGVMNFLLISTKTCIGGYIGRVVDSPTGVIVHHNVWLTHSKKMRPQSSYC